MTITIEGSFGQITTHHSLITKPMTPLDLFFSAFAVCCGAFLAALIAWGFFRLLPPRQPDKPKNDEL